MIKLLMHSWEHRLSRKDKNRQTLPFDWGFEFLNHGFVPSADARESILRFNQEAIPNSADFFAHEPLSDYQIGGDELKFPSSVQTPYPENNNVYARIFRAPRKTSNRRAIVVLPQWNADPHSHVGLSRLLSRLGITAVRLMLPYHEKRNPVGPRADYMVSSNIGRTIQAIQQSVQDARRIVDWLQLQGYERIGIVGTSVGSCISYLTFLHDKRINAGVFNHVSSYFGDVVWTGISTQHVRRGIEGMLTRDQLHAAWAIISPNTYVSRFIDDRPKLFISARYDLTFPPDLSHLLLREHQRHNIRYDVAFLPCGHYTTALAPFKYLDGYLIAQYLRKHL